MERAAPVQSRATGSRRWMRNGESWTLRYSVAEIWMLAAGSSTTMNMPAPPPPPPPPSPPIWQRASCA